MKKKARSSVNKGIQADNVTAEVLAVGDRARAVKNVTGVSQEDLIRAISDMRKAIAEIKLDQNIRMAVDEDVHKLESAVKKEKPDKEEVGGILKSISGKLKKVGVVLSDTAGLIKPVKKIAAFLGTTLKLLGFLA